MTKDSVQQIAKSVHAQRTDRNLAFFKWIDGRGSMRMVSRFAGSRRDFIESGALVSGTMLSRGVGG